MAHWRTVLPNTMLEIQYESLHMAADQVVKNLVGPNLKLVYEEAMLALRPEQTQRDGLRRRGSRTDYTLVREAADLRMLGHWRK
jgi:hypothetical protein